MTNPQSTNQPPQSSGVSTGAGQGNVNHQPEVQSPPQHQQQPTYQPPQPQHRFSRDDLMAAIESMPEKLVKAIQEIAPSSPPAQHQANSNASETGQQHASQAQTHTQGQGQGQGNQEPAKKNGFADWWFN